MLLSFIISLRVKHASHRPDANEANSPVPAWSAWTLCFFFYHASPARLLYSYSSTEAVEMRVLWLQADPCGQSAASEAKPVRNNVSWKGRPVPFSPGGKPSVFHSDTHGRTEVRGVDASKSVCAFDLVFDTTAHECDVMLESKATAGSMGVLMTHNAVHWTRKCPLNQGGPLTVAEISHHRHDVTSRSTFWWRGASVLLAGAQMDSVLHMPRKSILLTKTF